MVISLSFAKNPTVFEHFYKDDTIHVTIKSDIKKLIKKKHSTEWWSGSLTWRNEKDVLEEFEIDIRTRGKLRKEMCYYPPLKLSFLKK